MRAWAVVVALAGCYDPHPPAGAPCVGQDDCPSGQECDPVDLHCKAPTDVLAIHDDSAADFTAAGAVLDDVTIEAQGFVGPPAYFTGGVRVSGIAAHAIPDADATTFEDVIAQPITGTAVVRSLAIDYATIAPVGLNLPVADDITVVVEAEVELDVAGTWGFELTANDLGFVDIAPPGGTFERLVADTDVGTTATFEAPEPGWYRIRGAFADAAQAHSFELRYDPPNVPGNFRDIPNDRIRARVGDLAGLAVDGFEQTFLLDHRGTVISTDSLAAATFATDPFGLDVGTNAYSLRWSGQFLVDLEGDYTFRIDTFEGHRAWIDGAVVADMFGGAAAVTVTEPVHLAAGWHDLVLDTHKSAPEGLAVAFTVESGPVFAGEAFPADHLRPVPGRIARFVSDSSTTALAITDGGTVTRSLGVELPTAANPQHVDVGVEVDHPVLSTIAIVADPPAGANVTLTAAGSLTGAGTHFVHRTLATSNAGSGWNFLVTDNTVDMMTGSITFAAITIVTDGGTPPFPPSFRYTSGVRELGDITAFGPLTWAIRQGDPSAAVVSLRTCDDAAACEAEPWTEVAFGSVPAVAPRRFAQYTVLVTTNGDVPTALDFIDLPYSALSTP